MKPITHKRKGKRVCFLLHCGKGELRVTKKGVRGPTRRVVLKRILLISTISVCVYCALSMIAAFVMCDRIFGRYEETNPLLPAYDALTDPPPRTRMTFDSGKNTLTGYLYEPEQSAGVILIAHGMRGGNDSHLFETLYFVEHGWSVFTFDGTASGESTGDSAAGLEQMVRDVRAAMDYLSENTETADLPLMLYGHSMGGYAATVAAEGSRSAAVVSIAGFDSPMDIMLNNGLRYVGGVAWLGYPFLYLQNRMTFGADADRHAVDAINGTDAPFLIVYGAQDRVIRPEESIYGNRDAIYNPEVSYLLVDEGERGGHSYAWYSSEAVAYRIELEEQLEAMEEQYGSGTIPAEVMDEFCDGIDRDRLFELDTDFMDTVLQFYTDALPSAAPTP